MNYENLEFEHKGTKYGFEAEVEFKLDGFDGIGHYEFWGSKGYDRGTPVWEVEDVTILRVEDEDGKDLNITTLSPDLIEAMKSDAAENCEEPEYCNG